MKKVAIILLLGVFIVNLVFPQKIGLPKIVNYYDTDNPLTIEQVWDIKKLKNGNILFASNQYFVEFDGFHFRNVATNSSYNFFSFDIDTHQNKIYVGSAPHLQISRLPKINLEPIIFPINIQSAWRVFCVDSVVFFALNKTDVLMKQGNEYKLLPKPFNSDIYRIFRVKNKVFFVSNKSICYYQNQNIITLPIKNTELLKEDIRYIDEIDPNTMLIGSFTGNFYTIDYSSLEIKNFNINLNQILKDKKVYFGTKYNDSTFIIATLTEGIFIIDKKGNLIETFNENTGLLSNNVYYVFVDDNKNIWLGTAKGVSVIVYNSPIRYIDSRLRLYSSLSGLTAINQKLVLGTYNGIFTFDPVRNSLNLASEIAYANNFIPINEKYWLLSSHNKIQIIDTNFKVIFENKTKQSIRSIAKSPNNLNRFYTIDENSFFCIYEFEENPRPHLRKIKVFEDINLNPDYFFFDKSNDLWIVSNNNLILVDLGTDEDYKNAKIYYYTANNGLPQDRINHIFTYNDTLYICYSTAVYKLKNQNVSKKAYEFVPTDFFGLVHIINTLHTNGSLFVYTKEGYIARLKNKTVEKVFLKANFETFFTNSIIQDNQIVVNSKDKIFIIDTNEFNHIFTNKFQINITSFGVNNDIFDVYKSDTIIKVANDKIFFNKKIKRNSIVTLAFNTNFYDNALSTKFQYFIKGDSEDWESFDNNKLIFRKIKPGQYTVFIRAQNYLGQNSNTIEVNFEVQKKWYERIAFIILFSIISIFIAFFVIRRTIRQLKLQKAHLEDLVIERTLKLEEQKEELELQTEELKEQKKILERETKRLNTVLQELKILSLVAQKTSNSVIIVDKRGKFDWWNRYFIEMFDRKLEQYKHLSLREAHKHVRPDVYREIKNYTPDKGIIQYTTNDKFDDGTELWYQTSIIPVETDDGTWFVVIDVNTSETKNLEKIIQANQFVIDTYKNQLTKTIAELNLRNNEYKKLLKTSHLSNKYLQLLRQQTINIKSIFDFTQNFFVIDLPKENISGDFNGAIKLNDDELIIYVGDATGHNSTGVVLSNICVNILKQQVLFNPTDSLSNILNVLNTRLYDIFLHTKDDFINLALVKINTKNKSLVFASSKINLLALQINDKTYKVLKADKYNLGEALFCEFNEISLSLNQPIRLYLTTDGWANQFDKMGHKKYGYNQIEKFLVSIQDIDFERHRDLILNEITLWRGNFDQVDDILIFGAEFW